nr:immunoglobulin heavy chain junction region [Mus musculus]
CTRGRGYYDQRHFDYW